MKKIVIVKTGSGVLLTNHHKLDPFWIDHIAQQVEVLSQKEIGVVLVVSGAVAGGIGHFKDATNSLAKQAAAGIGQAQLTAAFYESFTRKHIPIAQVLLTNGRSKKKKHLTQLLKLYLNSGIVPVLNENDVIELNSFGGNDYVAGFIAHLLNAHQVIMLSQKQKSVYGIGGGIAKQEVITSLMGKSIKTYIVNGKSKNIILRTVEEL